MKLKQLILGLLVAVVLPLVTTANVLPEDAFWNKDTAYVAPAPVVSEPVQSSTSFSFTSVWNAAMVFTRDFRGYISSGLMLFVK